MVATTLSRRASETLGVAFFAGALVWLVSLATYDAADAVWFFYPGGVTPPMNLVGRVGAFLAELSYQALGLTAFLIPVQLVVLGWHAFWCRPVGGAYAKLLGLGVIVGCSAGFLSLAVGHLVESPRPIDAGGYLGAVLTGLLAEYFNRIGSSIVILTVLFLAVMLSTQFSLGQLLSAVWRGLGGLSQAVRGTIGGWWTQRQRARQRRDVVNKHLAKTGSSSARTEILARSHAPERPRRSMPRKAPTGPREPEPVPSAGDPAGDVALDAEPPPPPASLPASAPAISSPPEPLEPVSAPTPDLSMQERRSRYTSPPISLLDSPRAMQTFDERQLMDRAHLLEEKCREFSVEGSVVQIHPGPVVTTFEFKPDAGVKYSRVTGLADDLCLAMQAESVLIERIPGKSTVGMQIPNAERDQISLRELLQSEPYAQSSSKLTLALGKTIHGEPVVADLATMPHLLIAGATGTGKSVCLNAMLTSILYRATPDEVRLIMIDPKRLELGMYADIPHLLTPVVVDPKQANNALRWAVREMEERYKQLAAEGVRNIGQYNRNVRRQIEESVGAGAAQAGGEGGEGAEVPAPLPYVILAIDELADLMMVASKDVEESIARLAQMARAVGIHLILATQRPSVDVITGLIKANLPSRIAFRVSSKVDSRTILDGNGAEQLLGKGDMLYLPPASSRCVRLHGPYISERETARLCSFLRKQGAPGYDESITADEKAPEAAPVEHDDLYDQAARIIVSSGQASISFLQRRLRIGFSRAARLVDMMEADGLVSAGTAGKPREVLVKPDYFDQVDLQLH
ncbi:MAG: DNA translocase FtsK [Acidobacteria bacterium]|nr:DNA translocase FtsK [Acidobacteriota bacterium]